MRAVGLLVVLLPLSVAVLGGCPARQASVAREVGGAAKADLKPGPAGGTGVALPAGFSASPEDSLQPGDPGYRIVHDETGIEFVWVPGGTFAMGTNRDELSALWKAWGPAYNSMPHEGDQEDLESFWRETADTEAPAHRAELDGFWIARTEVTIGQWRSAMGSVPRQEYVNGAEFPVTSITYADCEAFCDRLGFGLPTEAQWEYAARGPESLQYPWGNDWDAGKCQCYVGGHEHEYSTPAGRMADDRSWCGALDMAANVREWCRDWFAKDFYASPEATQKNPECTTPGEGRVIRGGDFESEALDCRGAARHFEYPDGSYYLYGLRPVVAG
jgi:formylglycine-generating enzyme required for sulfatase activity